MARPADDGRPAARRAIGWAGAVFVGAIVAQAGYEIVASHEAAVRGTGREVEAQARVIAEQSARSVQAVDVALRQLAEQHRRGQLAGLGPEALREHLRAQAAGLVQIDGVALFDAAGRLRGSSITPIERWPQVDIGTLRPFRRLHDEPGAGLVIDAAIPSPGSGLWIFPMGRRLVAADGGFGGVAGAGGLVEYFERFYRATYPDPSTRIALLHRDGWLLARHPRDAQSLGMQVPRLDALLAGAAASPSGVQRLPSPIDGLDHFVALRPVPDYPLVVAVSREAGAALAPWRRQAVATGLRTLALGAVAGWLLVIVLRQVRRLDEARASLATSEARYALAMTGSDEGHWLWSIPERQVYVSARLAELFHIAGGAQVLRDDDYFDALPLHPDDRARVRQARLAHVAGQGERLDHEFRIVDPVRGEVRWIHTRAQCFRDADGRPLRMAGSTVDATERKRTELALRASEERYALAMTGSRSGHWVWDAATDDLYVSPTLNELLGLPPDTVPGTRGAYFARVRLHPEDQDRVQHLGEDLLRGRIDRAEAEYRIVGPDGAPRWILDRAQRFPAGEPGDARIAGVSIDITDRKAAEAERERLAQQLRQAQKLEAIGTLAGGIAHDFNNILAAILGYGELAQRDAPAGSALRRHVDAAMSAAQRARSLVERILAFSRSGMGERVPVHVRSVVEEALVAVRASLPPGLRLDVQLACGDAGLIGDPTQLHQVVLNLCTNAVQAMADGGVLQVRAEIAELVQPLPVATSVLAPGRHVRLTVADTGAGIPPALRDRIFDPFFTTKEVGVGTGLGLSLVHGIVTDLGGGIDVDSTEGEGSRFSVWLPAGAYVAAPAARPAPMPTGRGEVVMLVDDETPLVRLGEEWLAELGYEPAGFVSARAALEAFDAGPDRFDAVLSDEAMPGMTGCELAAALRARRPALPVVLVSGFVTPALAQRARALGVHEVLGKPLDRAELARALAAVLRAAPALPAGSPR